MLSGNGTKRQAYRFHWRRSCSGLHFCLSFWQGGTVLHRKSVRVVGKTKHKGNDDKSCMVLQVNISSCFLLELWLVKSICQYELLFFFCSRYTFFLALWLSLSRPGVLRLFSTRTLKFSPKSHHPSLYRFPSLRTPDLDFCLYFLPKSQQKFFCQLIN